MKVLIAIPCFDMVHTEFMRSMLDLEKPAGASYTIVKNTMIYAARNIIALNAIECGFDRVVWFDSDMSIPKDAITRMMQDMDGGAEMVSGLYFGRRENSRPIVYKKLWWSYQNNNLDAGAENYIDFPDGLFECDAVGFGCCATSVNLLKCVQEEDGLPFQPLQGIGEDLSFCYRVRRLGEKIYCDSHIRCGHIGQKEYRGD